MNGSSIGKTGGLPLLYLSSNKKRGSPNGCPMTASGMVSNFVRGTADSILALKDSLSAVTSWRCAGYESYVRPSSTNSGRMGWKNSPIDWPGHPVDENDGMSHIDDEDFDRYCLGLVIEEAELAIIEEHLLWRQYCLDRGDRSLRERDQGWPEPAHRGPEEIMNLEQILKEMRTERDLLNDAIASFERLAANGKRKRGRPPAWMKPVPRATRALLDRGGQRQKTD